jgi:hypothetical protein
MKTAGNTVSETVPAGSLSGDIGRVESGVGVDTPDESARQADLRVKSWTRIRCSRGMSP